MRKLLNVLLLWSVSFACLAQTSDTFADGDFVNAPTWIGNTGDFKINSQNQLQTNASSVAKTVYLSTSNTLTFNVVWNFSIEMDFNPSTNNQVKIYLISNNSDITNGVDGYFVEIGESGSTDGVHLYKQTGTSVTKIISGGAITRTNANIWKGSIKVYRTAQGFWDVQVATPDQPSFISQGTVTDTSFMTSSYFGISCEYTTSNSELFYFDDIDIQSWSNDNTAPLLTSTKMANSSTLHLEFNEPMLLSSCLSISNYTFSPALNVFTITSSDQLYNFDLSFDVAPADGLFTLTIKEISDVSNNLSLNISTSFIVESYYQAQYEDIIINEIMADPNPSVDLPLAEYIELWNISTRTINLYGWTLSDGTSTATLSMSLNANQYLILCANSVVEEFTPLGTTLGLSILPSLNNAGDSLTLRNQSATLISQVHYYDTWYKDNDKKEGGWSLELIDPKNKCIPIQNWKASKGSSGGTPAKINSVYLDNKNASPLSLSSIYSLNAKQIKLNFSREVDSLATTETDVFSFPNYNIDIATIVVKSPTFNEVILNLNSSLPSSQSHTLQINNLYDCGSNSTKIVQDFLMPEDAQAQDILINEVLFNPISGGSDFVEIYNNSSKIIDTQKLYLATHNAQGQITSNKNISSLQKWLLPHSYFAISNDTTALHTQYPTSINLLQSDTPSFADESGDVIVLYEDAIIDELIYNTDMHFSMLKNVEGVSLERVSLKEPTNAKNNFRSAASTCGFATPGYKNSQSIDTISPTNTKAVSLSSKTFSPNNDGFEDYLDIYYQVSDGQWIGFIYIYNFSGQLIKKLAQNETLSSYGKFAWDGIDDNFQQRVPIGIYILKADLIHSSGQKITEVYPFAVAGEQQK